METQLLICLKWQHSAHCQIEMFVSTNSSSLSLDVNCAFRNVSLCSTSLLTSEALNGLSFQSEFQWKEER